MVRMRLAFERELEQSLELGQRLGRAVKLTLDLMLVEQLELTKQRQ